MAFAQVYMRTNDGQRFGPVSMNELLKWHGERRVPEDAILIDVETNEERPVLSFPALTIPPPPMAIIPPTAQQPQISATDHLIPAKNPNALIGYYLGVFGIALWILGPFALVLGIRGLINVKNVGVGRTHSLVAIILGGLDTLLFIALILFIVITFLISATVHHG